MAAWHRFIHGLLPWQYQTVGAVLRLMGFLEEPTVTMYHSSDYDKGGY